jgi:hypothetical protein
MKTEFATMSDKIKKKQFEGSPARSKNCENIKELCFERKSALSIE